jgi:hypothetical protein
LILLVRRDTKSWHGRAALEAAKEVLMSDELSVLLARLRAHPDAIVLPPDEDLPGPRVAPAEAEVLDKLRANADLIVRVCREDRGVELTFDQAGVEWIAGYINRLRDHITPDVEFGLINTLGSFVGECIIRTYGGVWVELDGEWAVQVSERIWVFPLIKVAKQFANGPEDSVAGMFSGLRRIMQT